MTKKYCIFITALFCVFLGVLTTATAISPDREKSELENRSLQQLPTLEASDFKLAWPIGESGDFFTGKFMSTFETYCNDQFILRDNWVALKSTSERLSGKQENNGVYFCDKDTLISRFDQPDQKRVDTNVGYVNQFVANAGVPVYMSLIPGAATIWADRLPEGAPNADQKAIIDGIQASSDAIWYDSYQQLWDHKDEDIFYRTDHHWTSLGAYYGYVGLAQALGYEPVSLGSYTETIRSTEFYGTVFSSSGVRWVRPDTISTYVPDTGITVTEHSYDNKGNPIQIPRSLYVESFLDVKDKYSMFLGGNQSLGVVTTQNTDKPKLLIIRDSYTDSLVPFLTPHYSEIHLLDLRYYKLSIQDYIEQNGIDQALVLYSVPNFVTDTNLLWIAR